MSKHHGTSNRYIASNRSVTVAAPISNIKERQSHGTEAGGGDHGDDNRATGSKYEEENDYDPGVDEFDDLPSQWGDFPAELAPTSCGGWITGGDAFDEVIHVFIPVLIRVRGGVPQRRAKRHRFVPELICRVYLCFLPRTDVVLAHTLLHLCEVKMGFLS